MNTSLIEKATFAKSWDPKVACMVTLTLVFLCGALAGAVAMNLGLHNALHKSSSFGTAAGKYFYFGRMKPDLYLTPVLPQLQETISRDFCLICRHSMDLINNTTAPRC